MTPLRLIITPPPAVVADFDLVQGAIDIAGFLVIPGLTGAIISWDHELDEWPNPQLLDAITAGTPRLLMTNVEGI